MVAIRVIRDITHRDLSVNLGMHFRGSVSVALACLPQIKLFTWDDGTSPSIDDSR